jgi:hypothetical protein
MLEVFFGDCDHWAISRLGSGILKLNLVRLAEFKMVMSWDAIICK